MVVGSCKRGKEGLVFFIMMGRASDTSMSLGFISIKLSYIAIWFDMRFAKYEVYLHRVKKISNILTPNNRNIIQKAI